MTNQTASTVTATATETTTVYPGWDIGMVTEWFPEASDHYLGLCAHCGQENSMVEPEAVGNECSSCGEHAVQGCDNVLIHFA